jgi:hypothetical protein
MQGVTTMLDIEQATAIYSVADFKGTHTTVILNPDLSVFLSSVTWWDIPKALAEDFPGQQVEVRYIPGKNRPSVYFVFVDNVLTLLIPN